MRQSVSACARCAARALQARHSSPSYPQSAAAGPSQSTAISSSSASALVNLSLRPRLPPVKHARMGRREYSQEEVLAATRAKLGINETTLDLPESSRRQSDVLYAAWQGYHALEMARKETSRQLSKLDDPEMAELFEGELESLNTQIADHVENRLADLLLAPESTEELPTLLSINPGVGGDEASLCSGLLLRTYERYIESKGWTTEVLSFTEGVQTMGGKGIKEITMRVTAGKGEDRKVYGKLRWEGGVHRFQRVPPNDKGRIQSSTAAVVTLPVIPEDSNTDLVDPKDVRTEVMRSRGAGGQHVNKTESAVRLTHEPTGITVSMQDSRSQHQNRAWAWEILRSRLFKKREADLMAERRSKRQAVVKGADRSDKIRSYNFPASRVSDHRIGYTSQQLDAFMDGDIEPVMWALREDEENRILQDLIAGVDNVET